jgi:hypothetical protein
MKVTINADGSVEFEVGNGDGQVALDLIRSLQQGDREVPLTPWGEDELLAEEAFALAPGIPKRQVHRRRVTAQHAPKAALSKRLTEAYEALDQYEAAHYIYIAKDLKIGGGAANQRLIKLCNRGIIRRLAAGIYTTKKA